MPPTGAGETIMKTKYDSSRAHGVWFWAVLFAAVSCSDSDGDGGRTDATKQDAAVQTESDAGATPRTPARPMRGSGLADGRVGRACRSASDCGGGSCMTTIPIANTPYPDGYCTGQCNRDEECGERGVCVPGLFGRAGSCYLGCDDAHPCEREGYRCRVVSNVGRCIAAPPPLPDGRAGSACASDSDCGGAAMSCNTSLGSTPAPGGYCSVACAVSEDCGKGGVCINGISIVTIASGRCLKACTSASECREGYECAPFGGPSSGGDGACTVVSPSADAGAP